MPAYAARQWYGSMRKLWTVSSRDQVHEKEVEPVRGGGWQDGSRCVGENL